MIIKSAGWADGILAAGKVLMQNKALRNAALGAGVGAVSGAASAGEGNRISGALKGASVGAAVGGLGTIGKDVYTTKKLIPSTDVGKAIGNEFKAIGGTIQKATAAFKVPAAPAKPIVAPSAATPVAKPNLSIPAVKRIDVSKTKGLSEANAPVHPNDPRWYQIPAIERARRTNITEADMKGWGL